MRSRLPFAGLFLFAIGCGGNIVPVSGRVTLDDKPLANATVIFQPLSDQANPGPGSKGKTDSEGKFSLTLTTGNTSGAVVGKHKVSITAYEGGERQSSGPDMKPAKSLVPAEYNSKSTLTFDVPPGGSPSANFDLKSMP